MVLPTQTPWLIQEAGLVGRDHVLDVNKSVSAARGLKGLQRVLNQVTNVALGKLDRITEVRCENNETERE